jgi:hypothetical protein
MLVTAAQRNIPSYMTNENYIKENKTGVPNKIYEHIKRNVLKIKCCNVDINNNHKYFMQFTDSWR